MVTITPINMVISDFQTNALETLSLRSSDKSYACFISLGGRHTCYGKKKLLWFALIMFIWYTSAALGYIWVILDLVSVWIKTFCTKMANNKAEDLCSFQKNICPQTGRLIKTPCGIISPNKESLVDHVPHCSPLVVSQIRKNALDSPALHCTTSFFNSCLAG